MLFYDFAFARVVHIVAIVGWIGGVWFVTFVVMPAIVRNEPPAARLVAFHRIEQGFAPQARIWVVLAGLSGFWMTWRADLWSRFANAEFWWMNSMLGLWMIFAVMLFIAEQLFLHKRMAHSPTPAADFQRMITMHHILSIAAFVTVLGAMSGMHGLL